MSARVEPIDPLPSLSGSRPVTLKWEGPSFPGCRVKPSLSWDDQVALLVHRGLIVEDESACAAFLAANNYYRFSGYARYYQQAPHQGVDAFRRGTTFAEISAVYEADEALRAMLVGPLARVELLLRAHTAYAIASAYGPYGSYLEQGFYTDIANGERTLAVCLRDIERSRERHILHYVVSSGNESDFSSLPIWSAVEAWSFGTLSKCIERGAQGRLAGTIANSLGIAKAGFAYRVRSLVYLRNRCAHHSRLWNHSVVDAGPTPNNVRAKAKKLAGQFGPRSVLDVIASLDDILYRHKAGEPVLARLTERHKHDSDFLKGLSQPQNPHDHERRA